MKKKIFLVLAITASLVAGCGSSSEAEELPQKQYGIWVESITVNGKNVPCIVADRTAYKGGVAISCNWNANP